MFKGVILDFNGTLYLDHDLNHIGWETAFNSIKTPESNMTYEEFEENIETLTKDYEYSKAILELFNKDASLENIINLSEYKEKCYMDLAVKLNRTEMMRGSSSFLDYLKENNIKYCIASMAPLINFEFYLEYLNLKRWFTLDNIVYDCEKYSNKNDQYDEAVKRMGLDLKDCLLIEDSPKVIDRAIKHGIKNIVYLNSKHKEFERPEIILEIEDFTEFDYKLLEK